MKVGFNVKYGYNEIEIPITDKTVPKFQKTGKTDLFNSKVTIYNDIPSDGVNARRFDRFVIDLCNIQNMIYDYLLNVTDDNGTPLLYRGCSR